MYKPGPFLPELAQGAITVATIAGVIAVLMAAIIAASNAYSHRVEWLEIGRSTKAVGAFGAAAGIALLAGGIAWFLTL